MNKNSTMALLTCVVLLLATALRAEVTLNSIRLGAANVESLASFYEGAFGLHEVNRLATSSGPEIFLNFGVSVDAAKANTRPPIVLMSRGATDALDDPMAHLILNVTDIAATVAAVKASGGSIDVEPRQYGNTGIMIGFAVDPAGNRIELIQRP